MKVNLLDRMLQYSSAEYSNKEEYLLRGKMSRKSDYNL